MNNKIYLAILVIGPIVLLLSIIFLEINKSQVTVTSDKHSIMHDDLAIALQASSYLEGYLQALNDVDSLELLEWEDYDQSITVRRLKEHKERLENLKGEK